MPMHDDTSKWPVKDLMDIPQKTLDLLDNRLIDYEKRVEKREIERDAIMAVTSKRAINAQASTRLLWFAVGGLLTTMLLTSC